MLKIINIFNKLSSYIQNSSEISFDISMFSSVAKRIDNEQFKSYYKNITNIKRRRYEMTKK